MSDLFGVLSKDINKLDRGSLIETINLSNNSGVRVSKNKETIFAASYLEKAPLKGERCYEDNKWVILFAGDIIEYETIPYRKIIDIFEERQFGEFSKFNGIFTISAYDKKARRLYLISDSRSQKAIYYLVDNHGLYFSSSMATFCRLDKALKFNKTWLYTYLFFNYPIASDTFLEGVRRMPPASVIIYDFNLNRLDLMEYKKIFKGSMEMTDEKEILDYARKLFQERVPKYFTTEDEVACGLTAGWDTRTMLALAPDYGKVTAYTYGVPGCKDLKEGMQAAKMAGIPHKAIYFDENFLEDLPIHILETVFLSSGLERISRSSLLYMYRQLTDNASDFPVTISGMILDIFRTHYAGGPLISPHLSRIFRKGKIEIDRAFWETVLKDNYERFESEIYKKLMHLKNKFGNFEYAAHHLSYLFYELCPNYFSGEVKIADCFSTLRVPSWDSSIIDLAYSLSKSLAPFPKTAEPGMYSRKDCLMQSYILTKLSPRFANIPIYNTKPTIVLKGEFAYQSYRIFGGAMRRISNWTLKRKTNVPLEDWQYWLNEAHKDAMDDLIFSKDSMIKAYIRDEYLDNLRRDRDIQWIAKLATAEIILRLIKNNWKRFW